MNQDGLLAQFFGLDVQGQLGRARPVVVHGQTGFAPEVECVKFFGFVEFFSGKSAAIFNVFEGIPKFFNFKRCFRFLKLIQALIGAGKCSRQSITTHLAVVVHPISRVL